MLGFPNPAILSAGAGGGPVGQQIFLSSGTLFVPAHARLCAVAIGAGGVSGYDNNGFWVSGGGGGLAYSNGLIGLDGEVLRIEVTDTWSALLRADFSPLVVAYAASGRLPGYGSFGDVQHAGGTGYRGGNGPKSGAGAAGYTSAGDGGYDGGAGYGGSGTSPYGGGSGASAGSAGQVSGGPYGGGAGYQGASASGGAGCVRIIWGEGRAFPITDTGDMSE